MIEVRKMAYIPPVSNNQYEQYAEREIKKNYDPFHVGPINRANPAAGNNNTNVTLSKGTSLKKSIKKKRTSIKRAVNHSVSDKAISEITGKGRNFNDSI